MTNAVHLFEQPLKVKIAGIELNIRRLGKLEILAVAENCVLQSAMRRIQQQAILLEDRDRLAFVESQYEKLPKGRALTELAVQLMNEASNELTVKVLESAIVEKQNVMQLIDAGTPDEVELAIYHALSLDKKKQEPTGA